MLFLLKRQWYSALGLLAVLVAFNLLLTLGTQASWNLHWMAGQSYSWVNGMVLIGASDALLFLLLWGCWRQGFFVRFGQLADLFRDQSVPAMLLATGVAGVGEEWLFRGLLQHHLTPWTGAGLAILLPAVLFGLLHWPADPRLQVFGYWAIWEGVLLGYVYHWSGSLPVTGAVHAVHDLGGFVTLRIWARWMGRAG